MLSVLPLSGINAVNASALGERIDALCRNLNLTPVGILYLPAGETPAGMSGTLVPGAFQLVVKAPAIEGLRGNTFYAIPEHWVPKDIIGQSRNLTATTLFTAQAAGEHTN